METSNSGLHAIYINNDINWQNFTNVASQHKQININNKMNKNPMQNNMQPLNPKRHKPNYTMQPDFSELARGQGIDKNEYDVIVSAARKAYEECKTDNQTISSRTGLEIKKNLGGQWFVFVSEKGKKFDFSLSTVASSDYLTFLLGNTLFQVCRLRE